MCDDPFSAIAGALIDAPCAWLEPAAIAESLEWTLEETMISLYHLKYDGLIDNWGEAVTLSPLAAERLGVRLVATSNFDIYRWSRESVSIKRHRPGRSQVEAMEAHDRLLRDRPDRAPGPEAAAIAKEEAASRRRAAGKLDQLPRPTVLLWGHALWEWDEVHAGPRPDLHCRLCRPTPRKRKGAAAVVATACRHCGLGRRRPRLEVCPGCRGRKLSPSHYCLRCDRWGLDGYFRRLAMRARAAEKRRKAA